MSSVVRRLACSTMFGRHYLLPSFLLLALQSTSVCPAEEFLYDVVPAKSQLVVVLRRAGIAARLAHDHAVEATRFAGVVHCDPQGIEGGRMELTVDSNSLTPDRAGLRKAFGLKGEIDANDRAKISKALHSPDQLDTPRYPRLSFVSQRVAQRPDGNWMVTGELMIRGVKQKIMLPMKIRCTNKLFEGSGQIRFKQSRFGYRPYRALLGAIQVRDEATLHIRLHATRRVALPERKPGDD